MSFKKILHIDDDEDDHEIFATAMLRVSSDAEVSFISSAKKALNDLIDGLINPDIIFLDLNMPEMNGQQFLAEIKRNDKLTAIPVMILSTSSHKPTIALTKELGAKEFITKPDNFEQLVRILRSVLEG